MVDKKVHQASDCWIISSKILALVTLGVGLFFLLTLSGCNSYEKPSVKPWRSEYKPYIARVSFSVISKRPLYHPIMWILSNMVECLGQPPRRLLDM